MSKPLKPTVSDRIGKADPVLSMGQRVWEVASNQWPSIVAFFATGGGMTYLAYITNWASALGPLGIGVIVLLMSFCGLLSVAGFQSLRAKRRLRLANARSVERWNQEKSPINPLAPEFHTQRVSIEDLSSPINNRIIGKRFIDCEMIGPRIITFIGSNLSGCGFADCDFVVIREGSWINNVTVFENVTVVGGVFGDAQ